MTRGEPLGWVDWFNNARLRSMFGDMPPVEFEAATTLGLSASADHRWIADSEKGGSNG